MEIVAGRGTPQGGVYIDVSHLGADVVQQMFPGMVERCTDFGYDLRRQPVEVSPTAHFHMGGVKSTRSVTPTCPACLPPGEDSGGAHGSNRLGGNGVAESTVFGAIAGEVAARESVGGSPPPLDLAQVADIERRALQPLDGDSSGEDPFAIRSRLEALMWDDVGLVRDGTGMTRALDEIHVLQARSARQTVPSSRRLNLAWTESLDVQNLLQVAEAVTRSALVRTESRGAHYRSDFPAQDDAHWLTNVYLRCTDGVEPRLWTEPVAFTRMSPLVTVTCVSSAVPFGTLRIRRFDPGVHGVRWDSFTIPLEDRTTVLDALFYVLREQDRSIAFRCACRAAMCGSCAMMINGHERLACKTGLASLKGPIRVEPLRNLPVIKDLVVDMADFFEKYQAIEPRPILDARRLAEPAIIPATDARRRDRRGSGLHHLWRVLLGLSDGGGRSRLSRSGSAVARVQRSV